ncbi:glycosyltransferase family 2 protein [Rubritepida flocculans]|uniref:glycosyltransferase family 2 protein n=1 Tax=Rubritepida flocculans TaxID=182403 RepID=UPI000403BEA0|nr:glycosyltransferase family 2 protein [Rubritepida flocculans]
MTDAAPPLLSVVICTFRRNAPLEALLRALAPLCAGRPVEVVVVDNSPEAGALPLLAALRAALLPGLVLRHAQPASISVARNAGVAASRAPWVAFLDDDSELLNDWVGGVLEAIAAGGAEGFFGPVRARYEGGAPPPFDPEGRFFSRETGEPDGARLFIGGPRRSRRAVMGAANAVLSRAACLMDPEPFDPAFGRSGGEDLDLFLRAERRGARFLWRTGFPVGEWVPASRQGFDYALLRAFTGGQVFVAVTRKNSAAPWRTEARLLALGAAQAALGALRLALARAEARPALRLALASALGKLRWRALTGLYALPAGGGPVSLWRLFLRGAPG